MGRVFEKKKNKNKSYPVIVVVLVVVVFLFICLSTCLQELWIIGMICTCGHLKSVPNAFRFSFSE
jgi:hypothetical protein